MKIGPRNTRSTPADGDGQTERAARKASGTAAKASKAGLAGYPGPNESVNASRSSLLEPPRPGKDRFAKADEPRGLSALMQGASSSSGPEGSTSTIQTATSAPESGPASNAFSAAEVRETVILLSKKAEQAAEQAEAMEAAGDTSGAEAAWRQADRHNERSEAQKARYRELTGFEVDNQGQVDMEQFEGQWDLSPIEYLRTKGAIVTVDGQQLADLQAELGDRVIVVSDLSKARLGEIVGGFKEIDARAAVEAKLQAEIDYIEDVLGLDLGGLDLDQLGLLVDANQGKLGQAELSALVGETLPDNLPPEVRSELGKAIDTVIPESLGGLVSAKPGAGGGAGSPAGAVNPHSPDMPGTGTGSQGTDPSGSTPGAGSGTEPAGGSPATPGGGGPLAPSGAGSDAVYTATDYDSVDHGDGTSTVTVTWTVKGAGDQDGTYTTEYYENGEYTVWDSDGNQVGGGEGEAPKSDIVGQSTTQTDSEKKEAMFETGGVGKKEEEKTESQPADGSEKTESTEETDSAEETDSTDGTEAPAEAEDVNEYTPGPDGEEMTPEEQAKLLRQMGLTGSVSDYIGRKLDTASFDTRHGSGDSTPDPVGEAAGGNRGAAEVYEGGVVDPGDPENAALSPGHVDEATMQAVYEAEKGGGVTDPED